jgi:nuclear GTP-binding protein
MGKTREQMRKYYLKALHKVVDDSDIIILVLDARDPEGCRSRLVEEEVRRREGEGKKLVFVLNKIGVLTIPWMRDSVLILGYRSNTKVQCSSMAQVSPPLNPNFAFPFISLLTTPKDKYFIVDCSFSAKTSQGI